MPFRNRQTSIRHIPGSPGTYFIARPATRVDTGTQKAAPHVAARRRSSGTQTPPRRSRHTMIALSAKRPDSGAPTEFVHGEDVA